MENEETIELIKRAYNLRVRLIQLWLYLLIILFSSSYIKRRCDNDCFPIILYESTQYCSN